MPNGSVSLPRVAALSIALAVFAPSVAAAQTPVVSVPTAGSALAPLLTVPAFARLAQGKNVWITTSDGVRQKGLVTTLSPTGLTLGSGSGTPIPFGQIVKVQEVTHRIRNGVLIGLAAGEAVGLLLWTAECDGDCSQGEILALSSLFAGMGAGTGAGIGALVHAINRNGDVIYDVKRQTTTVALAPILSPTRKGVAFSMTWR